MKLAPSSSPVADARQPRPPLAPPSAAPAWVHALVRLMDEAIAVPGTKFRIGVDAIVGLLVPGVGDAVTAASHITLLYYAFRARMPAISIARMVLNVALDELWGSVPIIGDLFDAGFRANRKNLTLLERAAAAPRRSHWTDYLVVSLAIAAVVGLVLLPLILLGLLAGAIAHWLR